MTTLLWIGLGISSLLFVIELAAYAQIGAIVRELGEEGA